MVRTRDRLVCRRRRPQRLGWPGPWPPSGAPGLWEASGPGMLRRSLAGPRRYATPATSRSRHGPRATREQSGAPESSARPPRASPRRIPTPGGAQIAPGSAEPPKPLPPMGKPAMNDAPAGSAAGSGAQCGQAPLRWVPTGRGHPGGRPRRLGGGHSLTTPAPGALKAPAPAFGAPKTQRLRRVEVPRL